MDDLITQLNFKDVGAGTDATCFHFQVMKSRTNGAQFIIDHHLTGDVHQLHSSLSRSENIELHHKPIDSDRHSQ